MRLLFGRDHRRGKAAMARAGTTTGTCPHTTVYAILYRDLWSVNKLKVAAFWTCERLLEQEPLYQTLLPALVCAERVRST